MTSSTQTRIFVAAVVLAIVAGVFAATSPHGWIGRFGCEIRGGEWTNRHSTPTESLVTSGYRCDGL